MGEVVTMAGNKLETPATLAEWLKKRYEEKGDIEHVVMIIERRDGFSELAFSRQEHRSIVFASAVLQEFALRLAEEAVVESEDIE